MPGSRRRGKRRPLAGRRPYQMAGLEQVRALSHPLRLRLLELFAERPRTTKQAAEQMGEAPTRLYHHVATLERAGLVRLRETRPNRGATEKYFEAVANRFYADHESVAFRGKKARQHQSALGLLVFDQAQQELVRALASKKSGDAETVFATRAVMRLSPAGAKRLANELKALLTRQRIGEHPLGSSSRGPHRRYSLTLALLPADAGGGEK